MATNPLTAVDWALPARMVALAVSRRRDREWRPEPAREPSIVDVYRALGRSGARAGRNALAKMRERPLSSREWIEVVVAALLFWGARGETARVEHVLRFCAAYYDTADLARALARSQRRLATLRRAGRPLPAPAETILAARDWADLARSASRVAGRPRDTAAPPAPAPRSAARRREPVVFRPSGGLGNQLFQYVAARGYADRVGAEVRADLVRYERTDAFREFLLPRFSVEVPRATFLEVARARRREHYQPTRGHDAALIEGRPGLRWLAGFWQHPAYLAGIEDDVRAWFRPRDPALLERARTLARDGRDGGRPLVALHVRRGDRVQGREGAAAHRALPLEYYERAIAEMPADSRFLVFSDTPADVDWCRESLGLPAGSVAFSDGRDPVFDLLAMAACDHLVLSASTMGWWAAWLCESPGKTVIVPDPLVAHGPVNADAARDPRSLPPGWRSLGFSPPERGLFRRPG